MAVVGHERIIRVLAAELPRVALFVGPRSVGKWTTAEWLCREHGVLDPPDIMRVPRLTAETARNIEHYLQFSPKGARRVVIVRIDNATAGSQHTILKALEEANETVTVFMLSRHEPLDTVASRAQVHEFSLLSDAEVEQILVRRMPRAEAERYAQIAGGHVQAALDAAQDSEFKGTVLAVLVAVMERNAHTLESLAPKWTDDHTELLATACRESMTQRWRRFDPAETEGLTKKLAIRILVALRTNARPRLVVRSRLMSLVRESS